MKHSANGRSLDRSIKMTGRGAAYIFKNDAFDQPLLQTTESLGYNNSIGITFNKETEDRDHTNFDVRTVEETIVTSMAPTCEMNFSEFSTDVMARYLNSKVTKVVGSTKTIELTVTDENITQDTGFFYPIEAGIDTVAITFGTATTAIENVHYTVQNGSIAFHSLSRQTANGAVTLLDPTSADVEVEMVIETLDSEVIEFETLNNSSYGLYVEIYYTFKGKQYMTQIWIHKVNIVVDSIPFKQDDDESIAYDVLFNILASSAITDPNKSKFFKKVTTLLPDA